MKKYTTKVKVEYHVDVTIEAKDEDAAIRTFECMVEGDEFTAEQLTPEGSVDVEFDGYVWKERQARK